MHHRATRMAMNPRGEARKARERRRSSRLSLFSRQPFSSCLGGRDFLVARRRFHCSGGRVTFVTPCPPPLAFTGPPPASVRLPRPVHACCPVSRPERCTHPAKKTLPVSAALSLAHVAAAATERQSATVYEGMLGMPTQASAIGGARVREGGDESSYRFASTRSAHAHDNSARSALRAKLLPISTRSDDSILSAEDSFVSDDVDAG